jgi:dsRNA-specific ribonuclease
MREEILKTLLQDGDIHKDKDSEELIFNPFNSNNKEINENVIQTILKKYGVKGKIHNINLYKRAFIHKSYVKRPALENETNGIQIVDKPFDCLPLKTKSNERLEFLGDGVLECIIKYYLYRRFPKENEGFMTEKKIALVKNETIGRFAYEIGLNKWYIISRHAEEKKIRTNLKKLGCLFEAFLGALFLDFNKIQIKDEEGWFQHLFKVGPGLQMAQIFVENIIEKHVNWTELIETDDNYKNILQVKIQKEFKTTPTYLEISKDDDYGYEMGVYIYLSNNDHKPNLKHEDSTDYKKFGSFENIQTYFENHETCFVFLAKSKHKIKKKAEQVACKDAINIFNK